MAAVLVWVGVGVTVVAALRLLLARDRAEGRNVFLRLHFVGPGAVLGAPLVVAGLALAPWSSWHDVAKLAIIATLLFVTGPATVITAARAANVQRRQDRE